MYQAICYGKLDKAYNGSLICIVKDVLAVGLYGLGADKKLFSNFLIGKFLCD